MITLILSLRACGNKTSLGAKRPCLPWKGRWLSVSETGGVCTSTEQYKKTPQSDLSVPKCRLTASPRGKPRAVTFNFHHSTNRSVTQPFGRLVAAPTVRVGKPVPFIERHPLSQPVRAASSPRGRAEGASRQGRVQNRPPPRNFQNNTCNHPSFTDKRRKIP